jgi:hypothetical protein
MKKNVLMTSMSIMVMAGAMAVSSCSKGNDVFDANAVEQNKQAQKEQQQLQKLENLKKAYSDAFTKEFGAIASGQDWGFGKTSAKTRTAITDEAGLNGKFELPTDAAIVSELHNGNNNKFGQAIWAVFYQAYLNDKAGKALNSGMTKQNLNSFTHGKPFGNGATGNVEVSSTYLTIADVIADLGDLSSYYLQHVDKNVTGGPEHNDFGQLYAYDYTINDWEKVTNFVQGKNNNMFVERQNLKLKGYTLMANMGTLDASKPFLQWNFKKAENTFSSDYKILKIEGDYYIGLNDQMAQNNGNTMEQGQGVNYSSWIIRIAKAEPTTTPIPEKRQGWIFCEDMGTVGDFDFNDVVFHAEYQDNGDIKIKVLAAGGTLKITIDGVEVTLGKMTNTGINEELVNPQEFTIKAVNNGPKYANLKDIPVVVYPDEQEAISYELVAEPGKAPQKFCTYVNVRWADEYINIKRAYPHFTEWVNNGDPGTWADDEVERFTDLDLTNNKD